jgi:hypothetical protein
MKGFNKKIFVLAAAIVMVLTGLCQIAIEEHEKHNSFNGIWGAITVISSILRFPIYTLFGNSLAKANIHFLSALALCINLAFYGFVVERIFSLLRKKQKPQ